MSYAFGDTASVRIEDHAEAMRHLALALHLVNERLSGSEALSDSAMAAVVALTHTDRLQGNYCRGMIHFNGLLRIVELRGGIHHLVENQLKIAQKVFRYELDFSFLYRKSKC